MQLKKNCMLLQCTVKGLPAHTRIAVNSVASSKVAQHSGRTTGRKVESGMLGWEQGKEEEPT